MTAAHSGLTAGVIWGSSFSAALKILTCSLTQMKVSGLRFPSCTAVPVVVILIALVPLVKLFLPALNTEPPQPSS